MPRRACLLRSVMLFTLPPSSNSFQVVRESPHSLDFGRGNRIHSEFSTTLPAVGVTGAVVKSPPRRASFLSFFAIIFAFHRTALPGVCVIYGTNLKWKWGQLLGKNTERRILIGRNITLEGKSAIPLNTFNRSGSAADLDAPNKVIIFTHGN
jgi:hypothetical protein